MEVIGRFTFGVARMRWFLEFTGGVIRRLLFSIYDWLACAEGRSSADLIFALAGRQSRKISALELFRKGGGRELLVSVGRFEIRRFGLLTWPTPLDLAQAARSMPASQRHAFVSVSDGSSQIQFIRRRRLGTWSEVAALSEWLDSRPGIRSAIIITSGAHLRRVRMCCHFLLPKSQELSFAAARGEERELRRDAWWLDRSARRAVLAEFPKLALYWTLLQMRAWAVHVRFRRV